MMEEISELCTWEEVIVDFLTGKKIKEEESYIKDQIKIIAEVYEKEKYFGRQDIEDLFDPKKSKKDKSQLAIDFQRQKLQDVFVLDEKPEDLDFDQLYENYKNKCDNIENKYDANGWISKAANDASSVSFATHVAKLTHSKIDSPSLYDSIASTKVNVLTTASLTDKAIDGAVAGNQFAPVFQFLELELKGSKLAAEFAGDSNNVLEPFANDSDELAKWNTDFKKALSGDRPSSHFLAKQIYFPIELESTVKTSRYHLLCHMKSSSLAHAIHNYNKLINDRKKDIEKLRDIAKFSEISFQSFSNNARISVTASNHSNASQLNGDRGGKLLLFSAQPPTWQSQLKPPLYKKDLFAVFSHSSINVNVEYLREYLLRYERIELSIKKPERLKWIEKWVGLIIDELLNYAATIQTIPAGWSSAEEINLKLEHQYFLDPYRPDETFQNARKASDWQRVVCSDFSHWLNRRLMGKEKKFTPQTEHSQLWTILLEQPLREYNQMIEVDIKFQDREQE
jgi:CRISPR-associated protein Csy1